MQASSSSSSNQWQGKSASHNGQKNAGDGKASARHAHAGNSGSAGSSAGTQPRPQVKNRAAAADIDIKMAEAISPARAYEDQPYYDGHTAALDKLKNLRHLLTQLRPPLANKREQIVDFFSALKAAKKALNKLQGSGLARQELDALKHGISPLLAHLCEALQSSHDNRKIDPSTLEHEQIQSLCRGLSVCAGRGSKPLLQWPVSKKDQASLQGITDILLLQAQALGLPDAVSASGEALDILNWVSAGLNAGLLHSSEPIRAVFTQALPLIHDWTAGDQCKQLITAHDLGRCAVQLATIVNHQLVSLHDVDSDGQLTQHSRAQRVLLQQCAIALCADAVLKKLAGSTPEVVSLLNVCNTLKELINGRVLSATDPVLLPRLAVLVQLISQLPESALIGEYGDCLGLSNFSNFLRTLLDFHDKAQDKDSDNSGDRGHYKNALLIQQLPKLRSVCERLLACINGEQFAQATPDLQVLTNLVSFVKSYDLQLQHAESAAMSNAVATPAVTPAVRSSITPAQQEVIEAARCLMTGLLSFSANELRQPKAISSLLSGLAYVWQRNLVQHTDELAAFIEAVVARCAIDLGDAWPSRSRQTALPALQALLHAGVISLAAAQPALQQVLGQSGLFTLDEIALASKRLGITEEVVDALPVCLTRAEKEPAKQVKAAAPAPVPAAARVIPGLTKLLPDVVMTSTNMTMTTVTSVITSTAYRPESLMPAQSFQTPKKVARHVPVSALDTPRHSAPVLVVQTSGAPPDREEKTLPKTPPKVAPKVVPTAEPKAVIKSTPKEQPKAKGKAGAKGKQPNYASEKEEWLALLAQEGVDPVTRLQALAKKNPAFLALPIGSGKQARSALFQALITGKPLVVAWMLSLKPGAHAEDAAALLDAIFAEGLIVDDAVTRALDAYLTALPAEKKALLGVHLRSKAAAIPTGFLPTLASHWPATSLLAARQTNSVSGVSSVSPALAEKTAPTEEPGDLRTVTFSSRAEDALLKAVRMGNGKLVEMLLQRRTSASTQLLAVDEQGRNALILAVESGLLEIVTALLKARIDTEHAKNDGSTALILAAEGGHSEIVAALLAAGADPDQSRDDGMTALMFAARFARSKLVAALLDGGASLDLVDQTGGTALIFAAAEGHSAVVATLTKKGAKINHMDRGGLSALKAAAQNGRTEVVTTLLEQGASLASKNDKSTALIYAAQGGRANIVSLLLKHKAGSGYEHMQAGAAMCFAAQKGHTEIVASLLAAGTPVDQGTQTGGTALMFAAQKGYLAVVEALLSHGADPDLQDAEGASALSLAVNHKAVLAALSTASKALSGKDALLKAVRNSDLVLVSRLLQRPATAGEQLRAVDHGGLNALIVAVETGNRGIVQALLKAGADWRQIGKAGHNVLLVAAAKNDPEMITVLINGGVRADDRNIAETALINAVLTGNAATLEILLNAGANPNWIYKNLSPLIVAAEYGHGKAVAMLLKHGALVNLVMEKTGLSAIVYAAQNGHLDILRVLLAEGADVDYAGPLGLTPLILAAEKGNQPMVDTLLKHGANPAKLNINGISPLMYAAQRGHTSTVTTLLTHTTNPVRSNEDIEKSCVQAAMSGHTATMVVFETYLTERDAKANS